MNDYEHPPWPRRHEPDITTAEVGCKVSCLCGWHAVAKSAPKAASVFMAHVSEAKEAETGDDRG